MWLGIVVGTIVFLGITYAFVKGFSAPTEGHVLPAHYDVQRYARGGTARKPTYAGVCRECGTWTDSGTDDCMICGGSIRELRSKERTA